jgi:Asp-tRNA(Asn)/Glu-tRNA(Gln) amidotransferase C subunit
MKTAPGTPERKRAVRLYQKLRADAIQKNKENSGIEEGSENLINFPIANVRRPNGAIGTQGVTTDQVAGVLKNVAGLNVSDKMSMRELVDTLKGNLQAQRRLRKFTEQNPIKVQKLPDGTYHLQDGHHRTFLLNLLGDKTVPAIVAGQQGVEEGYRIVPPIDKERYGDRSYEGLEGPFRARNGKVYYYDPKAGMAYDPDTDFYIDYDELKMMDRETSETKKPDQVRASEPKPKKVKPNTGGQSPHPFQGRLVGENDDESIAVKLARLKQMLDQKDWERLSPEQKAEKLRKDRAEAEQRRSEYFDEASPPERNPVAKHASKFNKSNVQKDRKKDNQRGYQKHKKPGAVSETTGVTNYTPKSQGGTRKELLAKYAKTKDPKDAAAARKAGATQTELKAVSEQAGNRRFDKYLMHEFIITVEHADGSTKRYISRGLDEKAAREKILGYFDQAKIVDVEQVQ